MKVISSFVIILVLGLCRFNLADELGMNVRSGLLVLAQNFDSDLADQEVPVGDFSIDCLYGEDDITVDDLLNTCANQIMKDYCNQFSTTGMYSNGDFMDEMKSDIDNYKYAMRLNDYVDGNIPLEDMLNKMYQGQTC